MINWKIDNLMGIWFYEVYRILITWTGNDKTMKLAYLAMAIFLTGMGLSGATPVLILGGIYFYAFFTYDANERKKEENRKRWLQNREREDKEK